MDDLFANLPSQQGQQPPQGAPQQLPDLFADMPTGGQPQGAQGQPQAPDMSGGWGAATSFFHNALDTASFGLADKAVAAGVAGASHLIPGVSNISYDEARANQERNFGAATAAHPYLGLAGDVAGAITGGGAAVKGLQMAEKGGSTLAGAALRSMAPQEGRAVSNVLRAGGLGGAAAAANEVGHTGKIDANTAVAAATGAVAGPIVGKVASIGAKAIGEKAYALLATKLGLKPAELQQAMTNFEAHTGQKPSIAMLLNAKQQGILRDLATANPEMATQLQAHQSSFLSQQPKALGGLIAREGQGTGVGPTRLANVPAAGNGRGQTIKALTNARNDFMDSAIAPIRKNRVSVSTDDLELLTDPRIRRATANDPNLRRRLNQTIADIVPEEDGQHLTSNRLTIDDIDALRQALRSRRSAFANPANAAHNSQTAKAYGEIMSDVSGLGSRSVPEYGHALDAYRSDSNYITGFKHGSAGNSIEDVSDPALASALTSDEGAAGHAAGTAAHFADKAAASETGAMSTAKALSEQAKAGAVLGENNPDTAVHAIQAGAQQVRNAGRSLAGATPSRVTPDAEPNASDAAVALIEGGMGMKGVGTARGARFLTKAFNADRLSPAMQKKIITNLTSTNPARVQATVAALKKAGLRDQEIRQIAAAASAVTGAQAGQIFVSPDGAQ